LTTAYQNTIGAQYWQWANGMVTNMADGNATIENAIGAQYFAGYYEFPYWKSSYFNVNTNSANVPFFANVEMYESTLVAGANFEHLFATYNVTSQDTTTPPLMNSLFNATTMQEFLELGMSTPNIATNNTLIYNSNF